MSDIHLPSYRPLILPDHFTLKFEIRTQQRNPRPGAWCRMSLCHALIIHVDLGLAAFSRSRPRSV